MNKNGFTIIEMLIVMVIIGIVAAISLPSYNKARNNKELLFAREQIAGDIRMAQNYSFNTKKFGTEFPKGGYGVYFDISDPKKYIIFADIGASLNQTYDGASETFQKMDLPRSVKILSLKVDGSDASPVALVFKPPYGKAFIKSGGNYYTKLEIEVKNSDGETMTIEAEDSGLIN